MKLNYISINISLGLRSFLRMIIVKVRDDSEPDKEE